MGRVPEIYNEFRCLKKSKKSKSRKSSESNLIKLKEAIDFTAEGNLCLSLSSSPENRLFAIVYYNRFE